MNEDNSRKRLGRGLAALIGEIDTPAESERDEALRADRKIPIEHIRANTNNPRRNFDPDDLQDLANSIAEHGIVQPILVRPVADGHGDLGGARYEIIAGERRWRAAQKANLHEIPVIIREVEDKEALELAIIENVQRADLNALEEALGYQQLIDEYDYTQAALGQVLGKSRSHIANMLRLLKLPEKVKVLLDSGELSAGHARALITADNPAMLAAKIVEHGLSVRQAEALTQEGSHESGRSKTKSSSGTSEKHADIRALEKQIEDLIGVKVAITYRTDGSGDIRLRYTTLEQLDDICRRLQRSS